MTCERHGDEISAGEAGDRRESARLTFPNRQARSLRGGGAKDGKRSSKARDVLLPKYQAPTGNKLNSFPRLETLSFSDAD